MPSVPSHAFRLFALVWCAAAAAGCATRRPVPPAPPPAAPVAAPETPPPPAPAAEAPLRRAQPTRPPPPVDPAGQARQRAVALLAGRLRVAPDAVTCLRVEPATWPDACLGLAAEGEIAAAVLTPGWLVEAEAAGARYVLRTDAAARRVRLAAAPPPAIGEPRLTWRDTHSFRMMLVGSEGVALGLRGRPLLAAPFPGRLREAELRAFLETYAPTEGRTAAGEIVLLGRGAETASPSEQRMLAEWARLTAREAEEGSGAAAAGAVLARIATDAATGAKTALEVDRLGRARLAPAGAPGRSVRLAPAELDLLYAWLDGAAPASWEAPDSAAHPGVSIHWVLSGEGEGGAGPFMRAAAEALLEALARRLAAPRSGEGAE